MVAIIVEGFRGPVWALTATLAGFIATAQPGENLAVINIAAWRGQRIEAALADPHCPAARLLAVALAFVRRRARIVHLVIQPPGSDPTRMGEIHSLSPAAVARELPDLAQSPGGVLIDVEAHVYQSTQAAHVSVQTKGETERGR